jgi:predicted transcriptional regulator
MEELTTVKPLPEKINSLIVKNAGMIRNPQSKHRNCYYCNNRKYLQGSERMASDHYAYILTVDEKYWNRLRQHNEAAKETHVFIRKSQVAPKNAQLLLFYVTKKHQILGVADFVERLSGNYMELWEKFGIESCFESIDEYKNFVNNRERMTFIRFTNFKEIANPAPKEVLAKILGSLVRFRLGRYLDRITVTQLV